MKTCLGIELGSTIQPDPTAVDGFNAYIQRHKALLAVEKTAVEKL